VEADPGLTPLLMDVLYDPQTSGGLLISLASDQAQHFLETLKKEAQMDTWMVGQVVEGPPGEIQII
jgi:selenide,water dikinase